MYCDYFGFSEKPFNITPNPRFIFLSKNHQEAFAHLLYGINNHAGFVELTGEVGTGKTTVLRTLLTQLDDDNHRTALIFNPSLSPVELLRSINREYNIPWEGLNRVELLDTLNTFLLTENREGHTIALVIDEAQNLEPAALEQIRLISNLETETDKLIQIVLAGQPELRKLLQKPELRQLGQRITVRYSLSSMDFDDTRAYIEHRLEVVGGRGAASFRPAAIKRIYRSTGGIPRLINIVCDRALLIAYTDERREVTEPMAARAISEIRGEEIRPPRAPRFAMAGLGLLAVAAVSLALVLPKDVAKAPPPSPIPQTAAKAASNQLVPAQGVLQPDLLDALRDEQSDGSEQQSAFAAFNTLAPLWKVTPLVSDREIRGGSDLEWLARKRNLRFLKITGSLDSLLRINSPAILEYTIPGVSGKRYLALTGFVDGRCVVAPPILGRTSFDKREIEAFWSDKAFVPWKNFEKIPPLTREGAGGDGVARLQKLLLDAKAYDGPQSGVLDAATIAAIKKFQAARGISPDGIPSKKTLILLYQAAGGFPAPQLAKNGRIVP